MRRWFWRGLFLVGGLGLLWLALGQADLAAVWTALGGFGLPACGLVLAVFFSAFLLDTASWQLMLPSVRCDMPWLYRLWKVRMVGEALNVIVPAGTLGGEPVKAVMLKKSWGIGYREGGASLIMTKTVNLLSLLVFAAVGFLFLLASPAFGPEFRLLPGAGLLALSIGVIGFFAVQRWRLASRLSRWVSKLSLGSGLAALLHHIEAVDELFVAFYRDRAGRFAAAFALAFANWLLGALELYVIAWFLGSPLNWAEAWLVEALAQLVRAGAFFIPGALGASEAAMVLVFAALTGRPELGLTIALVRRGRELVWILWGLAIGGRESLSLPAERTP